MPGRKLYGTRMAGFNNEISNKNWSYDIGATSYNRDLYYSPEMQHDYIEPGILEPEAFSFRGMAPRNYRRSDERMREEVCELFMASHELDPTEIEVTVENSEITLEGEVDSRRSKRLAEAIAESVIGVSDIHNRLSIRRAVQSGQKHLKKL